MGILRLILALSVVLAHSTPILGFDFAGGEIAVKAFYIISGFYMTLILNEKYIGKNHSFKLFITNRFMRLFPVYWVVCFLTLGLSIIMVYSKSPNVDQLALYQYFNYYDKMNLISFLFLVFTNIFLFGQDVVMFLGLNMETGNLFFTSDFQKTDPHMHSFLFVPQAWTIGVELTFYLIAPFLVRKRPALIIVLIIISLITRLILGKLGLNHDPWTYRFFFSELTFFLLGYISYQLYLKIKTSEVKPFILNSILWIVIFFTIILSRLPLQHKDIIYYLCFFSALPFIFFHTRQWKLDSYIGELSYPIYISHLFIFFVVRELNIPFITNNGITLCILTVLFSILINELISKRIEKIRQQRVSSRAMKQTAGISQ